MNYKFVIRPKAEVEIEEAYQWYEARQSGLGKDFLLRVDACLSLIQKNPYSYPVKYKQVRQALLHRFPYSVFLFSLRRRHRRYRGFSFETKSRYLARSHLSLISNQHNLCKEQRFYPEDSMNPNVENNFPFISSISLCAFG